jgi:hypothetical protein
VVAAIGLWAESVRSGAPPERDDRQR